MCGTLFLMWWCDSQYDTPYHTVALVKCWEKVLLNTFNLCYLFRKNLRTQWDAECRTHQSNLVAVITVPRLHSDIRLPCNYLPLPHNGETSHFSFQLISYHQYLSKQIFFSEYFQKRIFQTLQTHFTTDVYRFQRIKCE